MPIGSSSAAATARLGIVQRRHVTNRQRPDDAIRGQLHVQSRPAVVERDFQFFMIFYPRLIDVCGSRVSNHDIPIGDRAMVTLQEDRPGPIGAVEAGPRAAFAEVADVAAHSPRGA